MSMTWETKLPLFEQAHARREDRQTSHQAAASVTNIGPVREAILAVLRQYGPMTDKQIIANYMQCGYLWRGIHSTPESIRSRRAELTRAPFYAVEACGETQDKRPCTIWRAK